MSEDDIIESAFTSENDIIEPIFIGEDDNIPLPFGIWGRREGRGGGRLRFVIVAFPGRFSYPFLRMIL